MWLLFADDCMRMFGEGAEAKIYSVSIFGNKALAKMRLSKSYRAKELDEIIRRSRTKREAKILYRLGSAGVCVPALLAVGAFSIYMERLNGRMLRDAMPGVEVYEEVGKTLASIHNLGVSHGDFTPANIMLCGDKVYVIDFGLAEITESIEEKAIDLLLMKRAIDKERYGRLVDAYSKSCKESGSIMRRLREIELRGRYQTRTLA